MVEYSRKLYNRLRKTIDVYSQYGKYNLVCDSNGNKLYYIKSDNWFFASWNKEKNRFGLWTPITEALVDELFDKHNKLRDGFVMGYYDMFKEWATGELKSLVKQIASGEKTLSEEGLKMLFERIN